MQTPSTLTTCPTLPPTSCRRVSSSSGRLLPQLALVSVPSIRFWVQSAVGTLVGSRRSGRSRDRCITTLGRGSDECGALQRSSFSSAVFPCRSRNPRYRQRSRRELTILEFVPTSRGFFAARTRVLQLETWSCCAIPCA